MGIALDDINLTPFDKPTTIEGELPPNLSKIKKIKKSTIKFIKK